MNTLICQGFAYDCSIGFHEGEKGVKQKILVDIEIENPLLERGFEAASLCPKAQGKRREGGSCDGVDNVQFDYFKANQLIAEFVKDKHFNLIETLGQGIAELLLEHFHVPSVKVGVTKKPLDMPNIEGVKFVCTRQTI